MLNELFVPLHTWEDKNKKASNALRICQLCYTASMVLYQNGGINCSWQYSSESVLLIFKRQCKKRIKSKFIKNTYDNICCPTAKSIFL